MLNLDTHILLYALDGALTRKERELLKKNEWGISAIVLWELEKLYQLKRIKIDIGSSKFKEILRNLHVWSVDLDVCLCLRQLDFKNDPADEIIAATSVVHKIPLLTRDRVILASKVVPLAM
jgi:PIN domain nuclease of toxin-antitoxin system